MPSAVLGSMVAMKCTRCDCIVLRSAGTAVAAVTFTPGAKSVTMEPKLASAARRSCRSVSACLCGVCAGVCVG